MKNILFVFTTFLLSISLNAQTSIIDQIMFGEILEEENIAKQFASHDFSRIWMSTSNQNTFGIIGDEHTRLKMKLIKIEQSDNLLVYDVYGKSCVDGNICEFSGTIKITKVQQLKELHFGVDDEYKDHDIKSQGLLMAEYNFEENVEQTHSGTFEGRLYSKWYLDSSNKLRYDDIQSSADGYFNNAFIGEWISYKSKKARVCNWGDFRVPHCNKDFDIGAGEFSPSEKYLSFGWQNYYNAWSKNDKDAQTIEKMEWWH